MKFLDEGLSEYAKMATQGNKSSDLVVLGKFNQDGISYVNVAIRKEAIYFNLENYDELNKAFGSEYMWGINEKFLQQQMQQGKKFFLSHNPFEATGAFAKEVDFLTKNGYTFEEAIDGWAAVK